MKLSAVNIQGNAQEKVTLPDEMFATPGSPQLLAQAVRVYLARQRQGSARVKTRGQVRGSGKKIWRQKGTGRARHGDRYAPIFVGGGIAHGPTGNQSFALHLPKRMRRKALFAALSEKMEKGEVVVVDGIEKVEAKTKAMVQVLHTLLKGKPWKTLGIIVPEKGESLVRAARNIESVTLLPARSLNALDVLTVSTLILPTTAIAALQETFLSKTPEKKENKPETKTPPQTGKREKPKPESKPTRKRASQRKGRNKNQRRRNNP